jgi:hypothetical protein
MVNLVICFFYLIKRNAKCTLNYILSNVRSLTQTNSDFHDHVKKCVVRNACSISQEIKKKKKTKTKDANII